MRKIEKIDGLLHPVRIGDVELKDNIILAPMAGVTDLPFRLLCARYGSALQCMEMVSAKAILHNNKNTDALMEIHPLEGLSSLQLFGSDPEIMGKMAAKIKERPFAILDINMGCPVPKVVNNGEGSALMKNGALVGRIVESVVKNIDKPVTVKIRKGFDDEHINAVEIAHIAQESGASAVTVHGRTREQYYAGKADWDIIAKVKEHVSIPVFGNGDVTDGESARAMLQTTGCDGVAVGRAVRGNPFIFREIKHYLETGEVLERPTKEEIMDTIVEHAKLQLQYKGEYIGVREMRKHIGWYSAGIPGGAKLRGKVNEMETMDDVIEVARQMFGR
ncbi:MAG: tRNA dihydrouridine synthase DusB [Lachnospiraceae bacterium]|nr:tRNA dihydrouridine synthase DusB [Candidatus Colinaster equi]